MAKTAIVYVDGFNLYYSLFRPSYVAIRGSESSQPSTAPLASRQARQDPRYPSRLKWLDPYALAEQMLPGFGVLRVEYFTARIKQKYAKGEEYERQSVYLRVLENAPRVRVVYGNYQAYPKWRPLVSPIDGYDNTHANVLEIREKKSDVNLACSMLRSAASDEADAFILVSNDTDFRELLVTVGTHFGKMPGILCPASKPTAALENVAKIVSVIKQKHLEAAQFPDRVFFRGGSSVVRPVEWGGLAHPQGDKDSPQDQAPHGSA